MYWGVKHTLKNGGKCKGWSPMIPKCTPILGLYSCGSCKCLKPWLESKKTPNWAPMTPLKRSWSYISEKPSHCSIRLNFHELKIWLPTINPLKIGVKWTLIMCVIHHWKDPFEGYKVLHSHFQKKLDLKKIWTSKVMGQHKSQFWDSHLGVLGKIDIWM
jgi:hypothetical protein